MSFIFVFEGLNYFSAWTHLIFSPSPSFQFHTLIFNPFFLVNVSGLVSSNYMGFVLPWVGFLINLSVFSVNLCRWISCFFFFFLNWNGLHYSFLCSCRWISAAVFDTSSESLFCFFVIYILFCILPCLHFQFSFHPYFPVPPDSIIFFVFMFLPFPNTLINTVIARKIHKPY
jgi:hypothetical protein